MRPLSTLLCVLIAIACLTGAARLNGPLRELRREHHISQADPLVNAPPLVAFTTVALGGFRGMIADWLWMRSSELQDRGQYFELVQLADWITKLEPRFAEVWAYQAWNLAYNVSVLFDDPADRWRWVRHGLTLLRDEGLRYNPGDAQLLYELGWIYQHKIGSDYDQAHAYYKQAWAAEMASLFDGPRPDVADGAAPSRLRDVYRLDPDLLRRVDEQYGPLDWRLPQAHAIYWAVQSRAVARNDFDRLRAERMIFQSLAHAFIAGRLVRTGAEGAFILSPNVDLAPRVNEAFQRTLREHPDDPGVQTAYRNFLKQAIGLLMTFNRTQEAEALFSALLPLLPAEERPAGLSSFLFKETVGDPAHASRETVQALVEGALYQSAFYSGLGDPARAAGFDQMAQTYWTQYMAPRLDHPELRERTGLPPLEELRLAAQARIRQDAAAR